MNGICPDVLIELVNGLPGILHHLAQLGSPLGGMVGNQEQLI